MKREYILSGLKNTQVLDKLENDFSNVFPNLDYELNRSSLVLSFSIDNDDTLYRIEDILTSNGVLFNDLKSTTSVRKVFILDGLDCANCAGKIERIAKRTIKHKFIVVDFATSRFIIETDDLANVDNLMSSVQTIASSVDNGIKVRTNLEHKKREHDNIKISGWDKFSFIIGTALFLLGVIVKFSLLEFWDIKIPDVFVIAFYLIAYALLGKDVITGAFKNIVNGRLFDEKFLMTLATLVALGIGYYEEAVSVMIFYKIGELLQENAVNKTRKSISSLLDIQPTHARLLINGESIEVDPLEIVVGDIILVKTGERIPLDGVVLTGEASLDVSSLTGETKYIDVSVGSQVISGSINTNGTLTIKVEKIYNDSTLSQILQMVENASSLKAKTETLVTKLAKYYTPTIVIMALLWALSPLLKIAPTWDDFKVTIYASMIFLVASCPCALVISIPLGFFGGIGGASKHGILVKGSNYLEALSNVGSAVFDKTGTLTKGEFSVEQVVSENDEDVLRLAAHCETISSHPIAKSIVNEYGKDNIEEEKIKIHAKSTRLGARIYLDDDDISVGNDNFMAKLKIKVPSIDTDGVVVYVAKNLEYVGYIIIRDIIKPEAKDVIKELQKMKINVAMITGDKENVAKKVASDLGINDVYYEMMPVDKVKKLRKLRKDDNRKQIFIGDGVNDAPVLSSADVGIAMGGFGSDAAIKVADIVLMDDDLTKIPLAIKIAKKTKKIVIQNICLALIIKALVLILAPLEISHMWDAIFADVGVSLIAILNSLRAAKFKK